MLMAMNAFQRFPDRGNRNTMNLTLHRLVEAMRFGYAAVSLLPDLLEIDD